MSSTSLSRLDGSRVATPYWRAYALVGRQATPLKTSGSYGVVERAGIEPATSALQRRRSPS